MGSRSCNSSGEEDRRFCYPRFVQIENSHEARYKSWQERGLWQGGNGEGEASKENYKSIPSRGVESQCLSTRPWCIDLLSSILGVRRDSRGLSMSIWTFRPIVFTFKGISVMSY